jgi:hypothetical protein
MDASRPPLRKEVAVTVQGVLLFVTALGIAALVLSLLRPSDGMSRRHR